MIKNVLIPLDDTPDSLAVLPVVAGLIAQTAAQITLFAASDSPHGTINGKRRVRRTIPVAAMAGSSVRGVIEGEPPRYAETPDQAVERRENELMDFLREAGRPLRDAGHRVDLKVHFGDPIEEICRVVRAGEFDLVAMASSNFGRTFKGSVAEGVLRRALVPVLLVSTAPRQAKEARLTREVK